MNHSEVSLGVRLRLRLRLKLLRVSILAAMVR